MKHFNRLYKTIMEEVSKTSKKTVIKESANIQEEMDAIRVAADIIKRAMAVNEDEVLEKLEEDVNYDSSCCAFEDYDGKGITREMWENSIKYGWMAETLPYFIDWQDYLFKDIEITPEERAILEKADNNTYVFSDEFEKGNLEGLDFCKEICSQFDVDIDPEELMICFAGEDDDMDYESVKKPVSRRRLIKEHRAHRPSRCRVIKEDRLTQDQWLDMLQEKFDGVVKDLCEKYPNELINSIDTEYFSSDPEDNACQILDGLFVDLIDRFPQNLLTDREKKWIGKYDAQWEGCEGLWSDYCWGGNDVGAYKDLRAKFPILADFVDKWVAEHPNEGTNAKYHITDPRAKNPPYPVAESVKKPVSKRKVIKEHKAHKPLKRRVIKESYYPWDEEGDQKEEIKSAINYPACSDPSKKCNAIIDSLTPEEVKKFIKIIDCEEGFDDIDWYDFKNDAKAIMKKYSSWCDQWKKDNQENVDYYNKWLNDELDEDDQPEEMNYGWVTDDRILRSAYSFYYMIGDALNEDVITDKLDALVLYGYLQMYWNSIDEPDYDSGIACCGVDLD